MCRDTLLSSCAVILKISSMMRYYNNMKLSLDGNIYFWIKISGFQKVIRLHVWKRKKKKKTKRNKTKFQLVLSFMTATVLLQKG